MKFNFKPVNDFMTFTQKSKAGARFEPATHRLLPVAYELRRELANAINIFFFIVPQGLHFCSSSEGPPILFVTKR